MALYVPPSLDELYMGLEDDVVKKYKAIKAHFRSYISFTDYDNNGFEFIHTMSELFFDDYDDNKDRGKKHPKTGVPTKEDLEWLEKKYESHRNYLIERNVSA